jgi:hypothetical protein
MIIFTDKFIPERFSGMTYGPIALIRPHCKDDIGLIEHEKVHIDQWCRTLGFHSFMYLFSKSYKLKAEVEAYKEQIKYYKEDKTKLFAGYLCSNYGFKITLNEAIALLK